MIFIHDENISWHRSGKITENIKKNGLMSMNKKKMVILK